MSEFNIKPSDIRALYQIIEDIIRAGLDYNDILKLVQKRTHPQMSMTNIKNVIKAIENLERTIIRNQKRFKK